MVIVQRFMPAASDHRFYPALESLRGICAIMVVLVHLPWVWHLQHSPIVTNAWLFVDFFFVLSGFVIAAAHGDAGNTVAEAKHFLIRRAFRLYPLHLVTMALMAALVVAHGQASQIDPGLALANLAGVHAWGFSDRFILNQPSWSISTEMAAYLLFAAACVVTSWRVAAMAGIAIVALALLLLLGDGTLDPAPQLRILRCLYGFGLGVGVWHLTKGKSAKVGALWPAAAAAVILGLCLGRTWSLAMPLVFAGVVAIGAIDRRGQPQTLLRLGRLSYAIYMLHFPILSVIGAAVAGVAAARAGGKIAVDPWAGDVLLALTMLVIVAAAGLANRLIEQPWRDKGRARASRCRRPLRHRSERQPMPVHRIHQQGDRLRRRGEDHEAGMKGSPVNPRFSGTL